MVLKKLTGNLLPYIVYSLMLNCLVQQVISNQLNQDLSMTHRREFIVQFVLGSAALAAAQQASAQLAPLAETDAQAKALGYVALGTKTDKTKYPKYAPEQLCSNCALYQGKADDKMAGCPLFAGKQVAAKGWCSAWVKKA
jgi:High potential iron-sulfur protein